MGIFITALRLPRLNQNIFSIFTSVVIIGIIEVFSFLNIAEFSNTPRYSSFIRPPAFILAQADSIDDFFIDAKDLRIKIDEELQDTDNNRK